MRRLAATAAVGLAVGFGGYTVAADSGPQVDVVEVTPAGHPSPSPSARPTQACRCPMRLTVDGVRVPPPTVRPRLQVCALGSLACLPQSPADVVDGGMR